MIRRFDNEAALATDAYIDLLLDSRRPVAVTVAHSQTLPAEMRGTIELVHAGLPRFHPSFLFEEQLAARLREGLSEGPVADVLRFRIDPAAALSRGVDRRVLIGGAAIASGVSVAAVYAFRHAARRARPGRLGREVIA